MVNDTLPQPPAAPEVRITAPDAVGSSRGLLIRLAIDGERHPSLGFLGMSGRKGAAQLTLIACD